MNYKAVIFDFDYTLGDSTKGIVTCANYALQVMNYTEAEVATIRKTIGLTLKDTFMQLTGCQDDKEAELFHTLFVQKADEVMTESTELLPYTLDILMSLKRNNIRTGIVTTKLHYRINQILEKFQATAYIDMIVGGEDVKVAKPDPEGLLSIVKEMGLKKEEALYIGDSIVDAMTAQNAGVSFIGVLTGTTTYEEFLRFPSTKIINNLSELEIDKVGLCM